MNTRTSSRRISVLGAFSLALSGLVATSAQATTYHVRTDGGDATQCTGRADAAYPGSGSAQACAWKNPNIALPPSGTIRIAGGDSLIIGAGSYQIGAGGFMQSIPSGPSATSPTRFLGKPGTTPKLVGIGGAHRVINMNGSSNIEVGNLEITDGSDCVFNHSNASAVCPSGGAWARGGLYAFASRNVWLHDLNIHGMAARGIHAGGLTDWTVERVKLNRNGTAGWNGTADAGSSNSGKIILRDIEIGWNGCGERVATGEPWACWAQQTGGYGDGLGTTQTGGQWLVEDAFVHHNTSDGLDFRYMDGADTSSVTMRRVYAVANAGNQIKIKGSSLIENSVLVGHCTFFKGKYFIVDGDHCRAYGSTVLLVLTGNDTAIVRHNSIAGEGDAQVAYTDGTTTDKIHLLNNAVVGFPYFLNGGLRSFNAGPAPATKTLSGNLAWNIASCPSGVICNLNPKLTNMALATFDAEPLSGSPLIDRAPMISAVTTDFLMGQRPVGPANDIGAYEYGSVGAQPPTPTPTPEPSCTRVAPTLSLSGPTAAVAAGSSSNYTISLRNNDSSGCSNTSHSLARTVPSGWSATLSTTSIALAPGASGGATLSVVSPTSATTGTYTIAAATSSPVGSVHTASAAANYLVSAPVATCVRANPTVTVVGPSAAVAPGTAVKYTVSVRNNDGACYSGKTFNIARTAPSGWSSALAASSSWIAAGATFSTSLSVTSVSTAPAGSYVVGVGVSSGAGSIHTAAASSSYLVADPIAPTCSRRAPTVSILGPTVGVAAGSTIKYTVSVRNNDDSCYSGKTFNIARTVPSGWSSMLGASSSWIAAGGTFSTSLSVKSSSIAKVGNYAIGVGVSSGAGAVHNGSASGVYVIR